MVEVALIMSDLLSKSRSHPVPQRPRAIEDLSKFDISASCTKEIPRIVVAVFG